MSDALSESTLAPPPFAPVAWVRDLILLSKPRLSTLVMVTTAGGLYLAPGSLPWWRAALTLISTAVIVGAANALNCYLERDTDALMRRTRDRPLPAGRLEPVVALALGIGAAAIAVPTLAWAATPLAAALGLAAFLIYVLVYTPMKRRSPWALVVGAVPGAIPPLLGWTALTGRFDVGGLTLFLLLFVWQLPHFLAIAVYLRDDYERADLRVLSVVYGEEVARRLVFASTALLIPTSLLLVPAGVADRTYGITALILGLALFAWTARGILGAGKSRWARRVFFGTLGYLTALFVSLGVLA